MWAVKLYLLAVLLPWNLCSSTDCGWPGLPQHGLVNDSSDERRETIYPAGTKVKYSCEGEGRKMFGSEVRECVDGRWSGSLPWCASNIIRNKKVAIEIHSPHSVESTKVLPLEITDGITNDSEKSHCVWVTGGERYVFNLIERGEHLIHRMLIYTKNPFPVTGNDWEIDVPHHWWYQVTDITPSPAINVINENMETVTELSIGIESRDSFEICEVELYAQTETFECGSPEIPAHGHLTPSSSQHGHVATYSCKPGYQIDGPIQRTCNSTQWTGDVPICILSGTTQGPGQVTDISSSSSRESQESKYHQANEVPYENRTTDGDWTTGELFTLTVLCLLTIALLAVLGFLCWAFHQLYRGNEGHLYEILRFSKA